jgi:pimeloyl-ACP methyl ester carboxylesterase
MFRAPAIDPDLLVKEGTVPFCVGNETHETWYRICGKLEGATQPPLVVLHGGPGMCACVHSGYSSLMHLFLGLIHDYVLPISDLAKDGDRAVIFYDQLGNGRSTHLRDKPKGFWTVELFIDEFVNLTEHLGIAQSLDLCGHSWGGMLAIELLLARRPVNIRRFVCANTPASIPRVMQERARLLSALPEWVQEGLKLQKTDMARFRAANDAFDEVHTIKVIPFPKEHVDSLDSIWGPNADDTVFETL